MIMLGSARDDGYGAMVGAPVGAEGTGNGQAIYVAIDNPDELCARAKRRVRKS